MFLNSRKFVGDLLIEDVFVVIEIKVFQFYYPRNKHKRALMQDAIAATAAQKQDHFA